MATKDKAGNWIDPTGTAVPAKYVSKIDKSRDKAVEWIVTEALRIRTLLEEFRSKADALIDAHIDLVSETIGARNAGGNYTLPNFRADRQVERKLVTYMSFDETFAHGKALLDEAAERLSKGANLDLAAIVTEAFRVGDNGKLNVKEILSMVRRTKGVKDKGWQKGRDIILDAIRADSRRAYLLIRQRDAGNGEWRTIRLDLAATGAAES